VSCGLISAVQAWPAFFGFDPDDPSLFPRAGSDMSGFTLEHATPQSFADDMAALVSSSSRVVLREPPPGAPVTPAGHQYVQDAEWT
jgi:hypothetical protein